MTYINISLIMKYDFEQLAKELHRPFYKTKEYRQVYVSDVNETYTADIQDLNDVKEYNDNIRYILVVMDVKSRYCWAIPMKNKDSKSVLDGFNAIFKLTKVTPKNIWVDQGKEFYNKQFENMCKKNNITLYSTYGDHKAALIERFNRTLKTRLYKSFTANNNYEWINILNKLMKKYNNTKHRTLGISPKEAYEDPNQIVDNIRIGKKGKAKFKVGDLVRISVTKGIFAKGYKPNWSIELFKVNEVLDTNPITYKIEDWNGEKIEGSFYANELLKTKFKDELYLVDKVIKKRTYKGKKQVFVSWLGYRENMNSWIDESELKNV